MWKSRKGKQNNSVIKEAGNKTTHVYVSTVLCLTWNHCHFNCLHCILQFLDRVMSFDIFSILIFHVVFKVKQISVIFDQAGGDLHDMFNCMS